MKKKKNTLPDFNTMTREEEAEWFDTHDLGDYWDELDDVKVVVELDKPKEKTLTLRLQEGFLEDLKKIAKNKGLTLSSLARMWLIEKKQQATSTL